MHYRRFDVFALNGGPRLLCRLIIGITDAKYLKLQETYPPDALDGRPNRL
jgi:hypothetical protein